MKSEHEVKIGEQMISRRGGQVIVVEAKGFSNFHWLYCCGLVVDAKDFEPYKP
jgi:hypothetical protein